MEHPLHWNFLFLSLCIPAFLAELPLAKAFLISEICNLALGSKYIIQKPQKKNIIYIICLLLNNVGQNKFATRFILISHKCWHTRSAFLPRKLWYLPLFACLQFTENVKSAAREAVRLGNNCSWWKSLICFCGPSNCPNQKFLSSLFSMGWQKVNLLSSDRDTRLRAKLSLHMWL